MAREEQANTSNISSDIRALNSSVLLLTQKLRFITRNEKILGRNIVVMNKKIQELESQINVQTNGGIDSSALLPLKESISHLNSELESLKSRFASKEELQELKYLLESINPLEFVTLEQAKKLLSSSSTVKKIRK